jgi:hypothetical protein
VDRLRRRIKADDPVVPVGAPRAVRQLAEEFADSVRVGVAGQTVTMTATLHGAPATLAGRLLAVFASSLVPGAEPEELDRVDPGPD